MDPGSHDGEPRCSRSRSGSLHAGGNRFSRCTGRIWRRTTRVAPSGNLTTFSGVHPSFTRASPDEWADLIDQTWGSGLPDDTKLQIFDLMWTYVDEEYGAYMNLEVDIDAFRDRYRPEIAAGVSRGRFAAIVNQFAFALKDSHTYFIDRGVNWGTHPWPGVPLFIVGAWLDNSRFGACLTPTGGWHLAGLSGAARPRARSRAGRSRARLRRCSVARSLSPAARGRAADPSTVGVRQHRRLDGSLHDDERRPQLAPLRHHRHRQVPHRRNSPPPHRPAGVSDRTDTGKRAAANPRRRDAGFLGRGLHQLGNRRGDQHRVHLRPILVVGGPNTTSRSGSTRQSAH